MSAPFTFGGGGGGTIPQFGSTGTGTTNLFGTSQAQTQAPSTASPFLFGPAPAPSTATSGLSFTANTQAAAKTTTAALPTPAGGGFAFGGGGGGGGGGAVSFMPPQVPPASAQTGLPGFSLSAATTTAAAPVTFPTSTLQVPPTTPKAADNPQPTISFPPASAQTSFPGFSLSAATTAAPISFSTSTSASTSQVPPTTPKAADNPQSTISFPPASAQTSFPGFSTTTSTTTAAPINFSTSTSQVPPTTPKAADNQAPFALSVAQPALQPLAQAPKPAENQGAVNQLTNQNYPFQNDTVETIIKKWKEELAGDIQRFKIQANRVSVWENQLHENFKNAQQLRQNIEKVDLYFEEIEKGCTEVETWQDELDNELEQIERNLNAHINQSDEEPNEDDIEREDILHEGENLDKYLQDMEAKLDKIMRDFNIARSEVGEDSSNNPIANIMQILNSHHNNLAWLDSKTKLLYAEINSLRDVNN